MIQIGEAIDLIVSIILTFYLISLIKITNSSIRSFWFLAILLILSSKFLSIIEGYLFPSITNILEHFSFMTASIMLAISIYLKEL